MGPQQVFVIYGLIGLLAIPLALRLPRLTEAAAEKPGAAEHRWTPKPLNILFFVIALGADGVFTATLSVILADLVPLSTALIAAGLLLASQRLVGVALALGSGPLVDRFGAQRLLAPTSIAVAAGLGAIALGHVYTGALMLIAARPLLATVAPIIAVQRSPGDRIGAMASYATWSDTGLALGPLIGTLALAWIGFTTTYGLLALAIIAALAWHWRASRPVPRDMV